MKLLIAQSSLFSWYLIPVSPRYLLQRGYAVAQLIEALRYKVGGGGFDSRRGLRDL
jgi:hypothetical protein